MSNYYIDIKVVWYKNNEIPVDITEQYISANTVEDNNPETNTCNMLVLDDDVFYSGGNLQITEGDTIQIYVERTEDPSWNGVFTDNEIMWYGTFVDHTKKLSSDTETLEFKINDFTYVLFNRFWSKSYNGAGLRTDEILINVISNQVDNPDGLGTISLNIDNVARFRNDSSQFPIINPNLKLKPVYEWTNELSQIGYTNDPTDLSDKVVTETMIFRLRGLSVYWYEPSSIVTVTIDEDTSILDFSEASGNAKSVNYLIIDCGDDFNGEPIVWYAVDKNSGTSIIKERYEHQLKIAGKNTTYDNAYDQLRKEYDLASNDDFIDRVHELAKLYSDAWFEISGKAKRKVNVTIPYERINIGDLIKISLPKFSQTNYRVISISHTVSKNDASTQLTLEARD